MLAATCALLSLISLATLDRKFRWSRYVAIFASIALDAILLWLLWFEPQGDSDIVSRTIGVLSIVIASVTVMTPVFHKLSHDESRTEVETIDAEILRLREKIKELEAKKSAVNVDQPASGFMSLSPSNTRKSLSLEAKVAECSTARAAK